MSKKPQLVEQTSKRFKALQALGVLAIIVGVIWLIVAVQTESETGWPGLLLILGVPAWISGRVLGWWFHG